MDQDEYFVEENVAEILQRPAPKKETLTKHLASPKIKKENRKRKNSNTKSDSAKIEEPKTKIANTTTNFTASDKNSDNGCFINRLPADLLLRIIELFPINLWPKMELVSRQFQTATFCAWRNVRDVDFKLIDDKCLLENGKKLEGKRKLKSFLQKLTARSPLISSISGFNNYVYRFDKSIIISVANFSRLRSVKFSTLNFSPDLFQLFFSTLKNLNLLSELNFTHVRFLQLPEKIGPVTNDECMIQIFRNTAMKLESFSYKNNDDCDGSFLQFIDVSNLKNISLANSKLNFRFVSEFLSRCSELRKLNINYLQDCNWRSFKCGKRIEILFAVGKNCPKLETLKMLAVSAITPYTGDSPPISGAFSHMVNLRRFDFTPAPDENFTDEMLTILPTYLCNLTYLYISVWCHRTGTQFAWVLSRMKKLQHLHLTAPINGSTVLAIAFSLHDLHTLTLTGPFVCDVHALDSLCTLEKLQKLTMCRGVENETLRAWAAGGLLNRLEVLQLLNCTKVSDAGFSFMAKYGSENLQRLQLNESAITTVGVRAILSAFKHLRELDLRKCRRVDPHGLEQIEKLYENVKIYKGNDE